jgi:peptide/nickel transport system substrate-binding protein
MKRRALISSVAAAAATSSLARPAYSQARGRTLQFVPAAPLTTLDPIWTTAAVTRVHGYLVFDSLYGLDGTLKPRLQMAQGAQTDAEGLSTAAGRVARKLVRRPGPSRAENDR